MIRPGDKIGPYILVRKLGQGGFGVVWLAERHGMVKTQFALKIPLDNEIDLDSFRAEAAIWARASGHTNVLPIIEADVYEGQAVIVSEYLPDGSLADWLKANYGEAPTVEIAVEMACGILAGLHHIHSQNIVHRDLKPANILLQGQTPRLTDFGIARVQSSSIHTRVAAGSPAYMAPEAFDAVRSIQTDIWSAGIICYQMLTGRLPFPQTDSMALLAAITRNPPAPFASFTPASLQTVVFKALEKDPAKRFQSAAEMRIALLASSRPEVANNDAARRMVINLESKNDLDPRQTQPMEPHAARKNSLAIGLAATAVLLALVAVVLASLKGWTTTIVKDSPVASPTVASPQPTPSIERRETPTVRETPLVQITPLPRVSPSIESLNRQPEAAIPTFAKTFTGTINNKINIEMRLVRNGRTLSGTYLYKIIGTNIVLEGTIDRENRVTMYGYDKGKMIDVFSGHLIANSEIRGTWSNATREKVMPFVVKAVN